MLQLKYTYLLLLIFTTLLISSCGDSESEIPTDDLELEVTFDVNVKEPSGLTVNKTGNSLYTVSDNTAQVYRLNTEGEIVQTFSSYKGQDLEGVSVYKNGNLLLAEERSKELVEFNPSSGIFSKHKIDYKNTSENSGIEGVAYAENLNAIFILNEKNPGLLIRLRSDFTVLAEYDLNFASDYSGIFYDASTNNLWIVSDQNKTLNKCTLKGDLIETYAIRVNQAEGVAITNNKIYIISDAEEKLYVYKKPQ